MTFDEILPHLTKLFQEAESIKDIRPVLINRDLNGRIRLILDEKWETSPQMKNLQLFAEKISAELQPHAYPAERILLFEADLDRLIQEKTFPLSDEDSEIYVVDRVISESNWSDIAPVSTTVPRTVFFSIKGGVGRSTALAASAWALAEAGKKVLVLDLDLESPGLSSSLLPEDRRPRYGITDWLIEDLVENGGNVFNDMVATSTLSHNGEIFVVPAYGSEPGEYVAKLGRAWMPKVGPDGRSQSWSQRLQNLLNELEEKWKPDIILIDSRAGIDEVASACVTDLSASTVLLFAIDGDQTWSGYRVLFQHWRKTNVVREIRDRLQIVGALIPELEPQKYFDGLQERAWNVFSEELYDELPAGVIATDDIFSFDETNESAPHYPWPVRWNQGISSVKGLHGYLKSIDPTEAKRIFGPLIDGIMRSSDLIGNN